MKKLLLFLLLTGLMASQALAGTFGLNFNDHSTQLEYIQALKYDAYGESMFRGRLLYNDDEDTLIGTLGAGVKGAPGNVPGLSLGINLELNGGDSGESLEVLALAIGGKAVYSPPVLQGLGTSARIAYAPSIFSFLDSDGYLETALGLSYALLPNAAITLEYQNILVDFEGAGEQRIDDTVRFGVRFEF